MNVEIVELKSNGHPDTLTDLIVEACASTLDKYYQKKYGRVLHYNVDKALFSAGKAKVWFGGGKIIKPPTFILGGQASNLDWRLKRELKKVIRLTINQYLPNLKKFKIEIKTSSVSYNLKSLSEQKDKVLANDTSFGVGYYPFSSNELKVFAIRDELDKMIKEQIIPIGELYKILLTPKAVYISAPLYPQRVFSREDYAEYKSIIEKKLKKFGNVIFNPDFEGGFLYMNLTGSAIECGDDGQVGRGNRYNGLITPCRPMTIEAYYGKNNKNHTGKILSKIAFEKAKEIYEQTGKYTEIILVGKIGKPIDDYEIYVNRKV